jgi:hypothetical protein
MAWRRNEVTVKVIACSISPPMVQTKLPLIMYVKKTRQSVYRHMYSDLVWRYYLLGDNGAQERELLLFSTIE